jgi:ribosome-associated heat shock protein Hsp15
MAEGVRIDKWLWAVRIFKTRSIASDKCKLGRIKINGALVKASREVSVDDVVSVQYNEYTRSVKVKNILKNRVGAKLVEQYLIDVTPQEEIEKLEIHRSMKTEFRPRGLGRPTKKERRTIDGFKGFGE